jgi:hypothetical protein
MDLTLEFHRDICRILEGALRSAGYVVPPAISDDELLIGYFNTALRRIEPRPRIVERSRELVCPPGFEPRLQAIREKAERGEDLRPHQGKEIDDPFYSDGLLNDWGIHHLHLGTKIEADGFVTRTGPVLFARVLPDRLFMLQIWTHGRGAGQVWTRQEMIEIIHENWPDSIARFRLKALGLEQGHSDSDLKQLRNAGILTPLETKDHTVYMPPCGGIATNGTSIQVGLTCDRVKRYLHDLETYFRENIEAIAARAAKQGRAMTPPYAFQLQPFGRSVFAVEPTAKVALFALRLPELE